MGNSVTKSVTGGNGASHKKSFEKTMRALKKVAGFASGTVQGKQAVKGLLNALKKSGPDIDMEIMANNLQQIIDPPLANKAPVGSACRTMLANNSLDETEKFLLREIDELWWMKVCRESAGCGSMEPRVDGGGSNDMPGALRLFVDEPTRELNYRHVFDPWMASMRKVPAFDHQVFHVGRGPSVADLMYQIIMGAGSVRDYEREVGKRNGSVLVEVKWALESYRDQQMGARKTGLLNTKGSSNKLSGDNPLTRGP